MTTAVEKFTKDSALAKPAASVREMSRRLERARQSFNEKLQRAEAEYVDAVGRAHALVATQADDAEPQMEVKQEERVAG